MWMLITWFLAKRWDRHLVWIDRYERWHQWAKQHVKVLKRRSNERVR